MKKSSKKKIAPLTMVALNNRINDLEEQFKKVKAPTVVVNNIEASPITAPSPLNNVKAGDYVYHISSDKIHKVTSVSQTTFGIKDCCMSSLYMKEQFRIPTKEELENHFNSKRTFKVGDIVICTWHGINRVAKIVKDISAEFNNPPNTNFELDVVVEYGQKSCHKEHLKYANNDEKESYSKEFAAPPVIEVGDYIKGAIGSSLYKVEKIEGDSLFISQNGSLNSYEKNFQKKASVEEIKKHLFADADKRGFKVCASVVYPKDGKRVDAQTITELIFNKDGIKGGASTITRDFKEKYFIVARYGGYFNMPIDELTILKDDAIIITVDGVDYKADFSKPGLVCFGCAEIDINLIKALNVGFQPFHNTWKGNRQIESIHIGKGLFTKDIIDKLYKRIKESK